MFNFTQKNSQAYLSRAPQLKVPKIGILLSNGPKIPPDSLLTCNTAIAKNFIKEFNFYIIYSKNTKFEDFPGNVALSVKIAIF